MSHDTFAHNLLLLMQDEIRCSFHFRLTAPANDNSETYEKYTWQHLRTINQLGKLFQEKSIHATWTIITFKISFYRIISNIYVCGLDSWIDLFIVMRTCDIAFFKWKHEKNQVRRRKSVSKGKLTSSLSSWVRGHSVAFILMNTCEDFFIKKSWLKSWHEIFWKTVWLKYTWKYRF